MAIFIIIVFLQLYFPNQGCFVAPNKTQSLAEAFPIAEEDGIVRSTCAKACGKERCGDGVDRGDLRLYT